MRNQPKPSARKSSLDKIERIEANLNSTEVRELRTLLSGLNEEFSHSRSFATSPIKFLLEDIMDRLLLVANIMQQGANFFGRRNPTLRFIEDIRQGRNDIRITHFNLCINPHEWEPGIQVPISDELGNPKQISFRNPDLYILDDKFASFLVDMAEEIGAQLRGFTASEFTSKKSPKLNKKGPKKLSKSSHHYWRRHGGAR